MKDIFTDLYNKVLGFFRQSEKKDEDESAKDVAYNRLKFVLMQDRTNLSPELMDRMRKELVELLSKYVEMDKEALELGFEQEGTQVALMLSIPVVRAKEEEEIEAILAKEDEEKAKKETEDNDKSEDEQETSEAKEDDVTEQISTDETSDEENTEDSSSEEQKADEKSEATENKEISSDKKEEVVQKV